VLEAGALEQSFSALGDACRRLDQLYIPTRYPNGLPDGVPHEFYDRTLADHALADLALVIGHVSRFLSP
jgi:HEPN domain-containing protein